MGDVRPGARGARGLWPEETVAAQAPRTHSVSGEEASSVSSRPQGGRYCYYSCSQVVEPRPANGAGKPMSWPLAASACLGQVAGAQRAGGSTATDPGAAVRHAAAGKSPRRLPAPSSRCSSGGEPLPRRPSGHGCRAPASRQMRLRWSECHGAEKGVMRMGQCVWRRGGRVETGDSRSYAQRKTESTQSRRGGGG